MAGFEKIDLPSSVGQKSRPQVSGKGEDMQMIKKRTKRKISSKNIGIILTCVGIFVLFMILAVALPAKRTYTAAISTKNQAKLFAAAMKQQNISLASEELEKTKSELKKTEQSFKPLLP